MGIPRKRSRRLELVDGRSFIYIVKLKSFTSDDGTADKKETFVTVQEDIVRPGRCMQFRYDHGVEITPSFMADVVNDAIKKGWDPTERGSAFVYEFGS